jgi:hypothetical protein
MTFMGSVMLPNVDCDRCILQVIEFMHPHGFNTSTPGPGGGYFYHHCAELKITHDPALPLFSVPGDGGTTDATSPNDGAGGTTGAGTAGMSGTTGAAGATGAAGSSVTGAAGSEPTGTGGGAGSVATAGASGSTGTAGQTAGTAGSGTSTGAGGSTTPKSSGGGCSLAGTEVTRTASPFVILGIGILAARRRRKLT